MNNAMHQYSLFKVIHHALILNIQLFSNNSSGISVNENISIRKAVLFFFPSLHKIRPCLTTHPSITAAAQHFDFTVSFSFIKYISATEEASINIALMQQTQKRFRKQFLLQILLKQASLSKLQIQQHRASTALCNLYFNLTLQKKNILLLFSSSEF